MVSKPDSRLKQSAGAPKRYNPSTVRSYSKKLERLHNIITQEKPNLSYADHKTKVVALTIHHLKQVYAQRFSLHHGIKEFGTVGVAACKGESKQIKNPPATLPLPRTGYHLYLQRQDQ